MLISLEQERGATLVRTSVEHQGIRVVAWTLNRTEDGGHETIELFVNASSRLPIAAEVTYVDKNGAISYQGHVEFDYPERGPSTIYDLGVPPSTPEVRNSAGM